MKVRTIAEFVPPSTTIINYRNFKICNYLSAMKYLFPFVLFLLSAPSFAQTIQNDQHRTIGFIRPDGTIQDPDFHTIGMFRNDGAILDHTMKPIGHLTKAGEVQNEAYRTIGWVEPDGTVLDYKYHTLGRINRDGTVRDEWDNAQGHVKNIQRDWVGVWFFFFSFY